MDTSIPVHMSNRQGSLPPHVGGKVNGYLSMTVSNIKWRDKSHGIVRVYVSWWGEKQKVLFIPQEEQNLTSKNCTSPETTYIYCVMTNVERFMAYLEDCEELNLYVYEQGADIPLGTATLTSLMSIILHNPFKTSCIIIDKSGYAVADLTVSFVFYNTASSHEKLNCTEKLSQSLCDGDQHDEKNKEMDREITMMYSNDLPFSDMQKNKRQLFEMKEEKCNVSSNESADIVSNSTISELLEQCQNIRQEMQNRGNAELQLIRKPQEKFACPHPAIMSYLLGKDLNKEDELDALEAIRTTSPLPELLHLSGIFTRHEENVKADSKVSIKHQKGQNKFFQAQSTSEKFKKQRKDSENEDRRNGVTLKQSSAFRFNTRKEECSARYTRFLRLTVQTLSLNYVGMQRVLVSSRALASRTSRMHQLPPGVVYFVEYEIPENLTVHSETQKTRRPWNCNLYRLCSRQRTGKCIHFYRQMIHLLANHKPRFMELLCNSSITFKIYSRHLNQRLPCLVGEASLCLRNIVQSCAFNALQELAVRPHAKGNPRHVLSLGTLKVKVEFGTNRTCFMTKPVASILPESSASSSESDTECEDFKTCPSKLQRNAPESFSKERSKPSWNKSAIATCDVIKRNNSKERFRNEIKCKTRNRICETGSNIKEEKILLFGLLHVSGGRELKSAGTYLVSHGFWKEDVMTSDVCRHTKHPRFKFHKIMPVLLSLEFLDRCYNNFIIVETWSQSGLLGISKLPLNQFYIAYRDPAVVEQLLLSKYPVIGADGWVDVIDPVSQHHVGQLNVVLALGTESQIQMLEVSRCLKEDVINSQMMSQSFSVESECIFGRSTTQSNNSTKSDPLLKFKMKNHSENLINSDFNDRYESSKSQHLEECRNGELKQLLLASQSNGSEGSLLKLTTNNPGEEGETDEQNMLTLSSSQRCQCIRAESCLNSCSSSSVISKIESRKCGRTYKTSESLCHNKASLSEMCLCVTSEIKHRKRNKSCTCHEQIDTNSHTHLKHSATSNTIKNLQNDLQKDLNEELLNISESIQDDAREKDNQPLCSNSRVNERDEDMEEIDEDVAVEGTVLESFILNSMHNGNDNCSSDGDSTPPSNCLPMQEEILRSEQQTEVHEPENLTHNMKSDQNEILEQPPYDLTSVILDETIQNHIYLIPQKINELNDGQSCKSNDYSGMTVTTENVHTQTDTFGSEKFFALIEIVNALYVSKLDNGQLPNCYVTIHTANNSVLSTPFINKNSEPIWNWSSEVWLPATLLENDARRLILKVWHKKNTQSEHPNPIEDLVIGFAALDLRVLLFGLPCISGWFNINNLNGTCEGHIQVSLTPLENNTKFQSKSKLSKLSKLNSAIAADEDDKIISSVLSEAPVEYFMSSLLEKCVKIVPQKTDNTRKNNMCNVTSLNQEIPPHSSTQSGNRSEKLCVSGRHRMYRNIEESSDVLNNPSMKVDSFQSILNEISFNRTDQVRPVYHKIQKTDRQDDSATSNLDITFMMTDQVQTDHSHRDHNVCLSYFTDTLRKKLHELDEVMQQMQDRSEYKGVKVLDNSAITTQENNTVHCTEPVLFNSKSDFSNVLNEVMLEDNTLLPKQEHNVFCKQKLYVKHNTPKEKPGTNHPQKNSASCSLLHSQCADSVDENFESSSHAIPINCNTTSLGANNEIFESAGTERTHSSEVFSGDILSYTDHLMCEALSDIEVEDIFNPLLFQHIVTRHQCQRCCSEHHGKPNKSAYSSRSKQVVSPSTSKISLVKPIEKSLNCVKIPSKIFDDESRSPVADRTELNRLCGTSFLIESLFHKSSTTSGAIENENKVCGSTGRRTPETHVTSKNSLCEYLTSNSSETENIYHNFNSGNERTKTNAAFLCNFVPATETSNDSEQFGTRKNIVACDMKCSCNNTSELAKLPSGIALQCHGEKILNIATQNKRREHESKKNYSVSLKPEESVNVNDLVAISDATIVLDAAKDVLQKNNSESSLMKLETGSVDTEISAKNEKV